MSLFWVYCLPSTNIRPCVRWKQRTSMFSSMLHLQPSVFRCLTHNRIPNINCFFKKINEWMVMSHLVHTSGAPKKLAWVTQVLLGGHLEPACEWYLGTSTDHTAKSSVYGNGCFVLLSYVHFPFQASSSSPKQGAVTSVSHYPWIYLNDVLGQDLVFKTSLFLIAHSCFVKKVPCR